jgi:hypothetical protein
VVQVVLEHLAEWPAAVLEALPESCRPVHIIDGEDVTRWAYVLTTARCMCAGGDEEQEFLFTLANFFAHASQRLATVAALALPTGAAHRIFFDSFIGSSTTSHR